MNYCHHCAQPLELRVPDGDDRERHCCTACGRVHYQNPKNVVGTVPVFEDKVLLCRRAIEPRINKWTLPAGFMENGETSLEGAVRETMEEAGAEVKTGEHCLYTLFNLPDINQMYMFFRAELTNLNFSPGIESAEVAMFKEPDIPWKEIAFPVVYSTLDHYFKDRAQQHFPVRMFDIHHHPNRESGSKITTTLISQSDGP